MAPAQSHSSAGPLRPKRKRALESVPWKACPGKRALENVPWKACPGCCWKQLHEDAQVGQPPPVFDLRIFGNDLKPNVWIPMSEPTVEPDPTASGSASSPTPPALGIELTQSGTIPDLISEPT